MNVTPEIHRKVRDMIAPGVAASEVSRSIDQQHRAAGADNGSASASCRSGLPPHCPM
jgi:Xaa-Pro dipeptidase